MGYRQRDGRRRCGAAIALGATLAGVLLAGAAPAVAAEPPRCWNPEVWARAGVTRTYTLHCPGTEHAEVIAEPRDSRFEGLSQGTTLKFRLTPQAGAPAHDELRLRLTGPGGETEQAIAINNVPLEVNTAPRCRAASNAQRTSATTTATIVFQLGCTDAERDGFTVYGGGPGTFYETPLQEGGGQSEEEGFSLSYTTSITSGQEQTSYYVVDSLGARSEDAPISIEVGPGVDRLPACQPNPGWTGNPFMPIHARPGASRRFAIMCEDADGDPFTPQVQSPPARGALTRFEPQTAMPGWNWSYVVWIEATYVPYSSYEGADPFTVRAGGVRGAGDTALGIVSRALPANNQMGCGASEGRTTADTAVILEAGCDDYDGDPLSARLVAPPLHGTATEPVLSPGRLGSTRLQLAYKPEPGFLGVDAVTVEVSDGSGTPQRLDLDVSVRTILGMRPPAQSLGAPFDWPELAPAPPGFTWLPALGQAAPVTALEQARRALGGRDVRLVKRIGGASFYALRSSLTTSAKPRRALAVSCPVACTVTSSGSVAGASAGSAKLRVRPGRASALTLRLSAAQRTRVKRAGTTRAVFRLKVARAERTARRGTVKLTLRG